MKRRGTMALRESSSKRIRKVLPDASSITNLNKVSLTIVNHLFSKRAYRKHNVVFSPLWLQVVLSIIAAGSKTSAQQQLLDFLQFKSIDHLNSFFSNLLSVVFKDDACSGGPRLSFTNRVWVDKSLTLQPSFQEIVSTDYKATLSYVDFRDKAIEVIKEVNLWDEKETNGLIKEILPPESVDTLTRLIFASALYFKGAWSDPFTDWSTGHNDFHLSNGHSIKVPFMTSNKDQLISVHDDYKVLLLPYKQGQDTRQFSMCIFLPNAKDGLSALVKKLNSESELLQHTLSFEKVKVGNFQIPKFKFSFGIETIDMLKEVGVVLPFFSGGLTKMVDYLEGQDIIISKTFHESFIEVNEEGTEAATASCAFIPKGEDFVADHPFLFLIREDSTQTILFVGQVLKPHNGSQKMDLRKRRRNSRRDESSNIEKNKNYCVPKITFIRNSSTNPTIVALTIAEHLFSKQSNNNIVFSPLLLQVILSIIAVGSKGSRQQQLLDSLLFETIVHLKSFYSQIIFVILKDDAPFGGPHISFANGVWVEKTLPIQTSLKKIVCEYKATLSSFDFLTKAVEVTPKVNSWAEQKTKGLINEILPPESVDELTRRIFGNSLYFKGIWNVKFDDLMTEEYDFHLLNGESVTVPFMSNKKKHFIRAFDDYKVLSLPYKQGQHNRRFSIYIFLPNEKNGLPALVEKIASKPELLYRMLPFKKVKVDEFRIPRFNFSFELETSHALKDLGMILPLSQSKRILHVSNIFQNSLIEVDEEGAKAVATIVATEGCKGVGSPSKGVRIPTSATVGHKGVRIPTGATRNPRKGVPIPTSATVGCKGELKFVADHPFIFVIGEVSTCTILFMGHMLNPLGR